MEKNYHIGVDLGVRPKKWWQRFLVWLGFRNRWTDMSCAVFGEKKADGTFIVHDIKYF